MLVSTPASLVCASVFVANVTSVSGSARVSPEFDRGVVKVLVGGGSLRCYQAVDRGCDLYIAQFGGVLVAERGSRRGVTKAGH